MLAVGLPVLGGTALTSARLAFSTDADVPWLGAGCLLLLFVMGILLGIPKPVGSTQFPDSPEKPRSNTGGGHG